MSCIIARIYVYDTRQILMVLYWDVNITNLVFVYYDRCIYAKLNIESII